MGFKTIEAFNINPPSCQYQNQEITKFVYSPTSAFHDNLMQQVTRNFNVDLIGLKDEFMLNYFIRNHSEPIAAVLVCRLIDSRTLKFFKY